VDIINRLASCLCADGLRLTRFIFAMVQAVEDDREQAPNHDRNLPGSVCEVKDTFETRAQRCQDNCFAFILKWYMALPCVKAYAGSLIVAGCATNRKKNWTHGNS
jgi:hypothetical protein